LNETIQVSGFGEAYLRHCICICGKKVLPQIYFT